MPDDDLIGEMARYYQARAPWHDQYMSYVDNETMEKLLAPVISFVDRWLSGRHVLEIACGTGNWTQVLARRTSSVLAIDISQAAVELARKKEYSGHEVRFAVADAYSLENLEDDRGPYSGAFAADWWSHIPKLHISSFLKTLTGRLQPGAAVVFIDMLPQNHPDLKPYRLDSQGNQICRRRLPDGREFSVVKNFPQRGELLGFLKKFGDDIHYHRWLNLGRWGVAFQLAGKFDRRHPYFCR